MANWEITTASSALEFDTTLATWKRGFQIDANHFVVAWAGSSRCAAQVFTVNTTTWAVTTANNALVFETQVGTHMNICQMDSNHFIAAWQGYTATVEEQAQAFTVNTSTWAITTAGAQKILWTGNMTTYKDISQIDANHFALFYGQDSDDGYAQVLEVNTTTWAVTTASAQLEFDTAQGFYITSVTIDSNHFLTVWSGSGSDGFAQMFAINTTTWDVTTAANWLEFDTQSLTYPSVTPIDSNHVLVFWADNFNDGRCQVLTINTTTWAVTTANSALEFDTQQGQHHSSALIDTNHVIDLWAGVDTGASTLYDGFSQVFTVNTTTWAVTTAAASFEFETTVALYNLVIPISGYANKYIALYSGDGSDGFAMVLNVEVPSGASEATHSPVTTTLSAVAPSTSYLSVLTRTVSALAVTLTVAAVTASYTQVNTTTPDPVSITATVVAPTATAAVIGNATHDPVSITSTVVAPTATYAEVDTRTPDPLTTTLTVVAPSAAYAQVNTTTPNPVSLTLTQVAPTKSYVQVHTATPNPLSLTSTVVAPSTSYAEGAVATHSPVTLTLTPVAPAASYIQINTSTPSPVTTTLSVVTPTKSYVQVGTATHDPVSITSTVVAPSAGYSSGATQTPNPIGLTLTSVTPTTSYVQVGTATPDAVSTTLAVVAPTAGYLEVASTSPDAVTVTLTPVAPTAGYLQVNTRTPDAISLTTSVIAPEATYESDIEIHTATPNPVLLSLAIPQVSRSATVSEFGVTREVILVDGELAILIGGDYYTMEDIS